MRATVMYRAGDVRVETVPDPCIVEPTDALVSVTRACICGSDLWPYQQTKPSPTGRRMGHEFIGGPAPVRAYEELLAGVLEGRIQPGRVFDRVTGLDGVPEGYRAMNAREAIKVMIEF